MGTLGKKTPHSQNPPGLVGPRTLRSPHSTLKLDSHYGNRELDNSMKLSCVVLTAVCATATIAAQVNSTPTATGEAPALPSLNTAQVATQKASPQDGNATAPASGVWLMTWTNDKGDTRHATLHIQQKGEALNGTANVQGGPKSGTFQLTGN